MDENNTQDVEEPGKPKQQPGEKTKVFDTGTIASAQAEPGNEKPNVPEKKSKKGLYIFIILLILVLAAATYFLFLKKEKIESRGGSAEIQQMQEMTQEVQGMETEIKQKEGEVLKKMDEYKEKSGGQSIEVNALNLSKDEKQILEKRIADEKDVSVKSLLQEILDKNKEIQELKDKVAEIEKKLPVPHIVKSGENHSKIALDFLVKEKGLESFLVFESKRMTCEHCGSVLSVHRDHCIKCNWTLK